MSFIFAWWWLLLPIGGSVLYRISRGKPVLFFGVRGASFQERNASGRSNRSVLTRFGGARGCLVVAVVGDRVVIRPWFPFTLMFMPEIYNLEFEFFVRDIVDATTVESFAGKRIDLSFRNSAGETEAVALHLRNSERFLEVLNRPTAISAVAGA